MTINLDTSGLGQGISSAGSILGQALQQRQQRQQQLRQQTAFSDALNAATAVEGGDIFQKMSVFQNALKESGVPIDPKTSMDYLKLFGNIEQQRQKAVAPTSADLYTVKTNQKFISDTSRAAQKANALLKEMPAVKEAIMSKDVSGPGTMGTLTRLWRKAKGGDPAAEQTLNTMKKKVITELGDMKGIMSNARLQFLQDALWDSKKSEEANLEAHRILVETLNDIINHPNKINQLVKENPDVLKDPTFENMVLDYNRGVGERFKKVPQGTPLDKHTGKLIYDYVGKDESKAEELAKELGYSF